ncbi:MAG TPA: VWA domain-containing protein [Tepidisphaeraceae bacterium]|jgi:hypothetical protein|nr:VWA domain-containing protein [Tepidisphaeraceae bacterium]
MFLNPIMLVGVAAAVVPLVLHLLSRARYKDVEWGAMMFLDGADGARRQSARFTQIVLLVMRSVFIALLAIALARPLARGAWAGKESEGRVTAALLLDCSASMGFDENGRTRFQMAQAAARQIIRGLRPGDRVSLILMGAPKSASELEPTGDLRAIETKIDDARVGYGQASLGDSLQLAADVLGRYEKSTRDVYVVSDRQGLSWKGVTAQFAADWSARMHGPGLHSRMFVLPVGSADADNIGVESVRLLNPPAIAGQPADLQVEVKNYGPVEHAAVPVTLEGNAAPIPPRSISLGAKQSLSVPFTVTFGQTGSQILTAGVKSAGYTGDDQLEIAVNVIPPIRVLIVSGDEQQGQFHSESDFLKWALAPHRSAGVAGADPCNVKVVPAEKWPDIDLYKFQVVVLANVERFTPAQAQSLEQYVYSGGRLLIAPGSLSRVDDYNTQLYRDGAGILPAMLEPATAADGSESTSLLGMDTKSPVFQFMNGRFELPSATIARHFPAIPRQVDARALASYLNNDPFLIEGKSQRGYVLLMTTPLDADWSTLPLTNFYLPFVQSAVRYLAGVSAADGNLKPGEPIRMSFDDINPVNKVMLTRPDGQKVKLDVIRLEKQAELRYSDTEQPGTYRLDIQERGKPPQTAYYIVRPPRDESDLTQLTDEEWRSKERSLGFTRVDPTVRPVLETISADREGRELYGLVLALVFALAIAEMAVSRVGSIQRTPVERAEDFQSPVEASRDERVHQMS